MQGKPRFAKLSRHFQPDMQHKKSGSPPSRRIATADFSVSFTNRRIKQYVKTVVPVHHKHMAYVTKRHQSRSSDLVATFAPCICLLSFPMTDFRQRGKKHSHPYSDWYRPGFSPDSLFTRHTPSGIADTLCEYSIVS